ncbi:MAG: ACP S-malonyltransferase [Chloroflexi bacterium]|nr:ACP S-malonyltransferase [Chloroflexota bacterium]MCL5273161.1 ACP S-malonyltransferase [Chloroflexota bacterium]
MSTAYVFPGQGSQFVGMGAELARLRPVAGGVFMRANAALDFDLSGLCFSGPEVELGDTFNTQPAIFAHSIAALETIRLSGEIAEPDFVAGHSLGEFSALCAAGALSFEDGVKVVRERGRLMKLAGELAPGSMAAVLGLDADTLRDVCEQATAQVAAQSAQPVVMANDNCPGQIVISGGKEAVAAAAVLAKQRGAKRVAPLPISIAAHSPLMNSVAAEFAKVIERTPFNAARVPVIANSTALPITHPDDIRAELGAQLTSPVRWTASVKHMASQGVASFVEVGPKDVLCNLIKRIVPGAETRAIG